jgi:Protein of unknown function (DUF2637)
VTTMTAPYAAADAAPDMAPEHLPEAPPASGEAPPTPAKGLRQLMWVVGGVAFSGGLAATVTGFGLSYETLVNAAVGWGFGDKSRYAFPVGVDGLIVALYAADLILTWRRMPKPLARWVAHFVTVVTVALNVTGTVAEMPGRPGVWDGFAQSPGRLIGHAAMPFAYVIIVEILRHYITRTARLEAGDDAGLTLLDWVFHPSVAWTVFGAAKLWGMTYTEARAAAREREEYRIWRQYREEIVRARAAAETEGRTFDEGQAVTALDELPDLLAPYGISAADALAMPDRMRAREQQRRSERERADAELRQKDEAEQREREHAATLANLTAQAEELRAQGQLDVLRAHVEGERRAAEHEAAAHADTAAIQAESVRDAADRAATEAARRASEEEDARVSAQAAADRRREAVDRNEALRVEAENAKLLASVNASASKAAEDEQKAKEAQARTAEAQQRIEEATEAGARAREAAATLDLRADLIAEAAGLGDRDRAVRRVARMLRTADQQGRTVLTTDIERALGVANSTATGYREAARALIDSGYDPHADPLHAAYDGVLGHDSSAHFARANG